MIHGSVYYWIVADTSVTSLDALVRFGHCLADPVRAAVLIALSDGPRYPSDLAADLDVSRQAMSNHLACLRGCGVVEAIREGRRTRYALVDHRIGEAVSLVTSLTFTTDRQACRHAAVAGCC